MAKKKRKNGPDIVIGVSWPEETDRQLNCLLALDSAMRDWHGRRKGPLGFTSRNQFVECAIEVAIDIEAASGNDYGVPKAPSRETRSSMRISREHYENARIVARRRNMATMDFINSAAYLHTGRLFGAIKDSLGEKVPSTMLDSLVEARTELDEIVDRAIRGAKYTKTGKL